MTRLVLSIILGVVPAVRAQIHADVATSMGAFTIELNHAAAPKTVANFITLAEGTRPWIDHAEGSIHSGEPFYNGVTFHRVIADFMSQTGSRKGDGTDGPGYTFRDEVNNGLTHSGPHVVSMANSGANTNGSQFFITDAATPHLDGKHTVFGTISSGQAVVDAINNVPTTNDRPNTPVVIQSITIRREGAAALAFDEHVQGLPEVMLPKGSLAVQPGGAVSLTLAPALAPKTLFRVYRSTDLANWSYLGQLYVASDDAPETEIQGIETAAPARAFYHFPAVCYPDDAAFSDLAMASYQVSYPSQTRSYAFDATGNGGTATITPNGDTPVQVPFSVLDRGIAPYRNQLVIDHGATSSPRYVLHTLHADTGSANTCSGRLTSEQWFGFWAAWNSGSFSATR